MPEQRFVFDPQVAVGRIALCVAFVALAVFFGLAGIVLRHDTLGWLAGLCYVASCLSVPRELQENGPRPRT